MAAVLLPIVQPSLDTSSINMLPNSANPYHTGTAARPHSSQRSHSQGNTTLAYRGMTAVPAQTYTFQNQPQFRQVQQPVYRAPPPQKSQIGRLAYPASASSTSTASSGSSSQPSLRTQYQTLTGKVDMTGQQQIGRTNFGAFSSTPDLSLRSSEDTLRATPERYRNLQRRTQSTSGPITPTQEAPSILGQSMAFTNNPLKAPPSLGERPSHVHAGSSDDSLASNASRSQAAGRYRRRSMGTMESQAVTAPAQTRLGNDATTQQSYVQQPQMNRQHDIQPQLSGLVPVRPGAHQRTASNTSTTSVGSIQRSTSAQNMTNAPTVGSTHIANQITPNRSLAAEAPRRSNAPSPLSRPHTAGTEMSKRSSRDGTVMESSPAAQHLAALSEKDVNRGVKSRLRRAFSFGSTQELKKASGEATTPAERARMRTVNDENADLTSEEAAVAAKQEAAGLGTAIYSGQGTVFGSTDNLSISSTASSASIMLRKMGRGAKKSARSIKGLFRPKSIIGAPVTDSGVSVATVGEISHVNVEAERERLGTSQSAAPQIPADYAEARLARESSESKRPFTSDAAVAGAQQDNKGSWGRKSVAASEFDRAEVLAEVKKGILKRSMTTDSATFVPLLNTQALYGNAINNSNTAINSAPGTPDASEPGPGYFLAANRPASASTRSLPGGGSLRNISFSPRIQLHDAWSATEYDRRGDIATCNRLTPMLAQQIKEELNTFKMEMEVHEMSKPYTHFF